MSFVNDAMFDWMVGMLVITMLIASSTFSFRLLFSNFSVVCSSCITMMKTFKNVYQQIQITYDDNYSILWKSFFIGLIQHKFIFLEII